MRQTGRVPVITAVLGDITTQEVDAVVNAASNAMRGGPAILRDCIARFPNGLLTTGRESARRHDDPAAAVYVPAFDPGHGMSAGAVHVPWWTHTGVPIVLDRYAAVRATP